LPELKKHGYGSKKKVLKKEDFSGEIFRDGKEADIFSALPPCRFKTGNIFVLGIIDGIFSYRGNLII